jgi:hypothetical protein
VREPVDAAKLERFMRELARRTRGHGRVYFTGGATAVLLGWRASTNDIDLKLDPEPQGAFEAIARLKDELSVNVELAAPDQFIPPIPDWRDASLFIARHGHVDFFHYDLRAQALAKIERGHTKDALDVAAMLALGHATEGSLREAFAALEPNIARYPALDADAFREKVEHALRR